MTMLFTHEGLGLLQSMKMVCKAVRVAFAMSCVHWAVRPILLAPPISGGVHCTMLQGLCVSSLLYSRISLT